MEKLPFTILDASDPKDITEMEKQLKEKYEALKNTEKPEKTIA